MRRLQLSLGQTVAVVFGGGLLMASTFLLMPLLNLHRDHGTPAFWLRVCLSLLPMAAGIFLNVKGGSDLKNGLANRRWPDEEVIRVAAFFQSMLWQGSAAGIMIVGCVMMFVNLNTHPHPLAWFFFILGQALSRMAYIFRRPPVDRPTPMDWRNAPPLHSDHWAER